jgi:rod shape-determining protein MreC
MLRFKNVFPIFSLFFLLSLLILFFFQTPLTKPLQTLTLPIQKWAFQKFTPAPDELTPQEKLQEENNDLKTQLAKTKELERDNQALRDQFEVSDPLPRTLLPAAIIGFDTDQVVIDKGTVDMVQIGDTIVIKNNLIGRITKISPRVSSVTLLSDPSTSLTVETVKNSAIGVIKSQGGDSMYLDNVVLSDKLEKGELVATKGDMDVNGQGIPPGIIIGKIESINKKASSLFQQAKIRSLVDISKARIVFVMTQK